ncbi:nickel-dependent hydrogenase large subunit [Candidatus Woesearchaeota archaeon]|nr:nickel-dependent hydrogenase large subunit [Candidatus Woesearchaeota archaeon]
MSHKKIIDPLNRIEGDLAIELNINNNNVVEDARCLGFVYRGFENIFIGKRPFDAMRMSQRSCGVCPVSHGTAGAYAIESAANNFKIPKNAELVRDIVLGANIIVSHATHFYFMWGPDLVNEVYKGNKLYPEILKRFDPLKSPHLKSILLRARVPLHSVVATFGGKFPHPGHAVPGGVCCFPKHIELIKTNTLLKKVKEFIEAEILNGITVEDWLNVKSTKEVMDLMNNEKFANSDVGAFLKFALDEKLHQLGEGTPNKFLAYGFGHKKDGSWLFKPGYVENGKYHELDVKHISEDTSHSYYETESEWRNPAKGVTKPIPKKEGAYSWIKSPRYFGHVCELGPLARQIVNGDPLITDLVKNLGVNTLTRTVARLHECLQIMPNLIDWVDQIDTAKPFYYEFPEIKEGSGFGLAEAPRGAVGHWVNIKDGLCTSYQIITPTSWNCSPIDSKGQKGAVEQALIGIKLRDKNSMLEAGHVVRSFDPCISCSIHAIGNKRKSLFVEPTR